MSWGTSIIGLNGIAQLAAARILDSLVHGAILASLAALLLISSRRYGSRLRFVIWFSALMAMIADPLLGLLWPHPIAHFRSTWLPARAMALPSSWGIYLFGLWILIAGVALGRIAVGLARLRGLRRTCVPVETYRLSVDLRETFARFQPWRNVGLYTSTALEAPTAIGFFRPAIVVPAALLDKLSPEDFKHVLLHELAHIRRWDDWTNLAQKVVKALLFFHPIVWWIEPRISLEREMACDEAVVTATADPRAYAQCLAGLAERSFVRRSLELVQGAVGRMRPTTARVMKLLSGGHAPAAPRWKAAVPALALFFGASLVLVTRMPDVVAFKDPRLLAAALPAADIGNSSIPTPLMARTPVNARKMFNAVPEGVGPSLASARVRQRIVRLASSRVPRVNRPAARGGVILVVFEERQQPLQGMSVWQFQVWEVTVNRRVNQADIRKVI